jgi:galactose-1-phosphate uridylyltransferase, family 1
MAELRWHPLTQDWVMIASNRQSRPQMPKDWCPFCPGSGKVPDKFDVLEYDNDFPALSQHPSAPDDVANDFFRVAPNYGKCEVILYSSNHTITLPELPVEHILKIVNLWCERFDVISSDPEIKYVFIFENRGEAVGVTMPHPHGQIYGYSFIPKKLELETESAKNYYGDKGKCLFCDWLENEVEAKKRIIFQNKHFTVFLPFFTEYPYGIYIMSNAHKQYITEFNEEEKLALAETLRQATGTLDSLFDQNSRI